MRKMAKKKDPLEVIGCAKGYSHEELIKNLHRHSRYSPVKKRILWKSLDVLKDIHMKS